MINLLSLHGGLVASWPMSRVTAKTVVDALVGHWRTIGLPTYAQFDNDAIFQGPERGAVHLLGRTFRVDPSWPFRLIRCEVHLDVGSLRCYALRRRQPDEQPLLAEIPYALPRCRFYE